MYFPADIKLRAIRVSLLCFFITAFGPLKAQTIAAGGKHGLAICDEGSVYAWGSNKKGQLSTGSKKLRYIPEKVQALDRVQEVAAGNEFSLALKKDSTVYAWGNNSWGQLGIGSYNSNSSPVQINSLSNVVDVETGTYHALALKANGTVWAWGSGNLGNGTFNNSNVPVQVSNLNNVIDIACGKFSAYALKSDGTVWAWGANRKFQLGNGTSLPSNIPVQVKGLNNVQSISAGYYHALALKKDETVWAWGAQQPSLGNGNTAKSKFPIQIKSLNNVKSIEGSFTFSLALKNNGTVWAWGANSPGVGVGTSQKTPVKFPNLNNVVAIDAGPNFSFAKKQDGSLFAWGSNSLGGLGIGDTSIKYTDTAVKTKLLVSDSLDGIQGPQQVIEDSVYTYRVRTIPGADTFLWSLPKGWNVEKRFNDTHLMVRAGSRNGKICVKPGNDCGLGDTTCQSIKLIYDLLDDTTICEGNTLVLDPELPNAKSIEWSTGANSEQIEISKSGTYILQVVMLDSSIYRDSTKVKVAPEPKVNLGPNRQSYCGAIQETISPKTKHAETYQWNTGDTTKTLSIDQEGRYWLKVKSKYSCSNADTTAIQQIANPDSLQNDLIKVCEAKTNLNAGNPGANYEWSTGETSQTITVEEDGLYKVKISNGYCSIEEEIRVQVNEASECPYLWMPNAFSPNGDGINEVFKPGYQNIKDFQMTIYNRWGEHVFKTNDISKGWDGTFKRAQAPSGNYFYQIRYQIKESGLTRLKSKSGVFRLIR